MANGTSVIEQKSKAKNSRVSNKKNDNSLREQVNRNTNVDQCDIPLSYNTTKLTLLARDPYWIYAYWEIAPQAVQELGRKMGIELNNPSFTVRMYDVTSIDFNGHNANQWFDIDVGPLAHNWYISLWNDNVSYCGEIGIRLHDGRFFALTRSNFITTPRVSFSHRRDTIWMEVKEDQPSPKAYVVTEKNIPKQKRPFSPQGREIRRMMYLTEEDIKAYYLSLFPLLKRVRGLRTKGRGPGKLDEKWNLADPWVLDFVEWSKKRFLKKTFLGASAEGVLEKGASEKLLSQEFSGASQHEQQKRQFFFELGCELIVYGRTEPDAEVWHGDKNIKLRKDGTFSLRFALPDGNIPLDFVAISHDKVDQRSISTSVERRRTIYSP